MAYSYVQYSGNGASVNYTFPFPYLDQSHITVTVNGVPTNDFTFLNSSTITLGSAPASGALIEIRRITPKDVPIVDFQDGSVILEKDLDLLATFNLYVSQETADQADAGLFADLSGNYTAENRRITGLGEPIDQQDAATKNFVETGMTSQLAQATQLVTQAEALVTQADTIISSFTVSTDDPSGGSDGDVWFKVTF